VTAEPGRLPEHTIDRFLGGLVTLVQPRRGHRAGLDAALLQALVPPDVGGHLVDLGCGVGTVAFCVAARAVGLRVTGVERSAELVTCAEAALRRPENGDFAARVRIVHGDATDSTSLAGALDPAAWVLMNPPYDAPGRSRPSPDARRRAAHIAEAGTLGAWFRTAAALLKPGGRLGLIHRAGTLPDVLAALAGHFGDIRVLSVHPAEGEPASRILVQATLDTRAPLRIMPGLILHEPGGGWTPAADAILRGRADFAMP
jgi:tRNA1(Val) A37 N6-methylase TrmN6